MKFIQNKQKWVKHWVLVPDKLLGDVSRYLSRWDGFQKHRETEHQNLYEVKTVEQILEGIPREVKEEEKEFHDFNTGIVLIEDNDDLPW
ncbi:TPA: hypothetical protein M4267_004981 [Klebsiella pneumoniae]|nr:hypothetical protein [Klebsiella pneumoniae]HDK6973387.1 hypothetical protein [Klebsiella pneumoniae]